MLLYVHCMHATGGLGLAVILLDALTMHVLQQFAQFLNRANENTFIESMSVDTWPFRKSFSDRKWSFVSVMEPS